MKKTTIILTLILAITAIFGMTSCSDKKETKKEEVTVNIKEEIQGYWYSDFLDAIYLFEGDELIGYDLNSGETHYAEFEIKDNNLIICTGEGNEETIRDIKIDGDVLSYQDGGEVLNMEKISESEAKSMLN